MRAIVCGGIDYHELDIIRQVLLTHRLTEIAEGGADGTDHDVRTIAGELGIPCQTFRADWQTHGRTAGPIRNQRMLEEFKPDAVIAFPGGRATADMIKRAINHGIRVIEVL